MAVVTKTAAYGLVYSTDVLPLVEGIPDALDGGVTWTSARVDRAIESHFGGTDRIVTADTTGSDPNASSPPIVVAPINNGGVRLLGTDDGDTFRQLQVDPTELRLTMQHPGTWTDSLIHKIMVTCSQVIVPAAATAPGTGYVEATGVLTVSDASDIVLGMMIRVNVAGIAYDVQVTEIDGTDITLHPRPPAHTAASSVYRLCVTYGPLTGAPTASDLVHLHYVVDGLGTFALYNLATTLRFEESDSGALQLVASMRPRGGVVYRHDNTEAVTAPLAILATPASNRAQSCFHFSPVLTIPQVAPIAETSDDFDARSWAFEIVNSFDESTGCGDLSGKSDPSITQSLAKYTGDSANSTEFTTMMLNSEFRTYVLGFGPPKTGGALMLPAGFLSATEQPKAENNARLTTFEFSGGQWDGVAGAAAGSISKSTWLFGVPLSNA